MNKTSPVWKKKTENKLKKKSRKIQGPMAQYQAV